MTFPLWYVLTMTWEPYQDATIKRIVTERDDAARKTLIDRWLEAKIHEVEIVGLTSTLMTGIVAAALSWFDTSEMPWSTLTCWFSGIFTGLTSLGTSGQQALGFRNMKGALGYEDVLRTSLGTGTLDANNHVTWEANYAYIYLLQIPVMTIKLTFILFGLGLEFGLWNAATKKRLHWTAPETKIAVFSTIALSVMVLHYCLSSVYLFRRSLKIKVV